MRIPQQKGGEVHQHAAVFFCFDLETPDGRLCKGIGYRAALVGVVADGTEIVVGLYEQDFGANPVKLDNAGIAQLIAVQADVIGTHTGS